MVDTDDPRAAPLRGLEEERLLGCLLETKKKFDCAKISDFVFEFDRSNAQTRCFANFLDVR
jgi:hypothetical protein